MQELSTLSAHSDPVQREIMFLIVEAPRDSSRSFFETGFSWFDIS